VRFLVPAGGGPRGSGMRHSGAEPGSEMDGSSRVARCVGVMPGDCGGPKSEPPEARWQVQSESGSAAAGAAHWGSPLNSRARDAWASVHVRVQPGRGPKCFRAAGARLAARGRVHVGCPGRGARASGVILWPGLSSPPPGYGAKWLSVRGSARCSRVLACGRSWLPAARPG
jgi:hypothetical protein